MSEIGSVSTALDVDGTGMLGSAPVNRPIVDIVGAVAGRFASLGPDRCSRVTSDLTDPCFEPGGEK